MKRPLNVINAANVFEVQHIDQNRIAKVVSLFTTYWKPILRKLIEINFKTSSYFILECRRWRGARTLLNISTHSPGNLEIYKERITFLDEASNISKVYTSLKIEVKYLFNLGSKDSTKYIMLPGINEEQSHTFQLLGI